MLRALARGAVRRFATDRIADALVWAQRASVQLLRQPADPRDDIGSVLAYLQSECMACCVLDRGPKGEHRVDLGDWVASAQERLARVVPDLIERLDGEDPAVVRAALERWCESTERVLALGQRTLEEESASVLAWAHSTLADLAELDDDLERWQLHKRRQLDFEDRYGLALTECSVALRPAFSEHRCAQMLVETPPPQERAQQCVEEAQQCRAEGDEPRAAFWLDRARHYRAHAALRARRR